MTPKMHGKMEAMSKQKPNCCEISFPVDGRTITVPWVWYPRLLHATPEQRVNWRIAGAGYVIHWPDIDEDLSTQGLLQGAPAPRGAAKAA